MLKSCARCGKQFDTEGTCRKYCGKTCAKAMHKIQLQDHKRKQTARSMKLAKCCMMCGAAFITTYPQRRYCGKGCSLQAGRLCKMNHNRRMKKQQETTHASDRTD